MMVGRDISHLCPERNAEIGEEILRVDNLYTEDKIEDVSFSVKRGEVVGFSGLVGSGRTETMRAIYGIDKIKSGEVTYFGKKRKYKNPRDAIKNGIGLLAKDKKNKELVSEHI